MIYNKTTQLTFNLFISLNILERQQQRHNRVKVQAYVCYFAFCLLQSKLNMCEAETKKIAWINQVLWMRMVPCAVNHRQVNYVVNRIKHVTMLDRVVKGQRVTAEAVLLPSFLNDTCACGKLTPKQ